MAYFRGRTPPEAPIFDASGKIVKYISIRFDVTNRKQAKSELENLAAQRKAEADILTQQAGKLLNEVRGAGYWRLDG